MFMSFLSNEVLRHGPWRTHTLPISPRANQAIFERLSSIEITASNSDLHMELQSNIFYPFPIRWDESSILDFEQCPLLQESLGRQNVAGTAQLVLLIGR